MGTPEPSRTSGILRRGTLMIGWVCVLAGTAAMLFHALPGLQLADPRFAMAAAFIPYGILAWLAATLLFALAGRRWMRLLAVLTLACLAVQISWARPYWPGPSPAPAGGAVTVMTINLRCDGEGLDDLAAEIARVRPDVLVLQGADTPTREFIAAGGWPGTEPHARFHPLQENPECGKAVISDHPVTDTTTPEDERPVVRIDLPGGPLTVIPVDAPTPLDGVDVWNEALAQFGRTAENHAGEPTLLIGDFNAVREHLPIRQMLAGGLADAAEQSRSGWLPTFPADRAHPPLMAIDHAFISPELRTLGVETFEVDKNAHLGLIVRLAAF